MTDITTYGGRTQAIKHNAKGEEYVTWKGQRLMLGMFMRDSEDATYNGTYGTSYFSAYRIKLASDGETAKVYYQHW